jgi:hypothetical protein
VIEIEKCDNFRLKFESLMRVSIDYGDDRDGIGKVENLSLYSSWICGEFSEQPKPANVDIVFTCIIRTDLITLNHPRRLFSFHVICCNCISAIQSHIIHSVIKLNPTDSVQGFLNNRILKIYQGWNSVELRL